MDKLRFIDLTSEYCRQVFDIEKACIESPWSLEQIIALAADRSAVARIGIVDGEVVCYYSLYNICNEGNINNLAVRQDFRRKGVGSSLLVDMVNAAKERGIVALTLEVNVNNDSAISLYEKFGFIEEGRRGKFYNGRDDALIMWKRNL